ncbi:MAG: multiheme c-type cytochrome [Ignavibacteria bacterium]
MKYISYFIFFVTITLMLLFLKNALEPHVEPVYITGSDKCNECHRLKNNGDQYSVWKSSKHSEAYNVLLSDKAKNFASKIGINAPETDEKCLKCHSTEFSLKGTEKAKYYNITEGVGCESCHGAGSQYSPAEVMKDENAFLSSGGVKGDSRTCKPCHSDTANKELILKDNACPFQLNDFDYKVSMEKIKHPALRDNK